MSTCTPVAGVEARASSLPADAASISTGLALSLPPVGASGLADALPVLALGAWFKHAACLLADGRAQFGPNLGDRNPAKAAYRPAGAAVGPDGSLYVVDGKKGRVWRIYYDGKP